MDHRSIHLFLNKQGLSDSDIRKQFIIVFDLNAMLYSNVRSFFGGSIMDCTQEVEPKIESSEIVAEIILTAPDEWPLSFFQDLAKRTYILAVMVYRRLPNFAALVDKHDLNVRVSAAAALECCSRFILFQPSTDMLNDKQRTATSPWRTRMMFSGLLIDSARAFAPPTARHRR
jgi:hypothetical protein